MFEKLINLARIKYQIQFGRMGSQFGLRGADCATGKCYLQTGLPTFAGRQSPDSTEGLAVRIVANAASVKDYE